MSDAKGAERAAAWVQTQRKRFGAGMTLGIGGPRESEAPGIYLAAESHRCNVGSTLREPIARRAAAQRKRGITFSHRRRSERCTLASGMSPPQFSSARIPLRPSLSLSSAMRSATIRACRR